MAYKDLFNTLVSKLPKTDTANEAGGQAYRLTPKHALAQYAVTGCMNSTFYASAQLQLDRVLALCDEIEPEYIAKVALYARSRGHMKDLPALLVAYLAAKQPGLMAEVFDRVIDNPKMLRNFVQIVRSGVTGRRSLGSLPKRMILQWLEKRSDEQLFIGSVGNTPSMADIIKMVHPKPKTKSREALFGYLLGRSYDAEALPQVVRDFEAYKNAEDRRLLETPDVPFQFLTSLDLADWEWRQIARYTPWQMTRMNLNAFASHNVFKDLEITKLVADRLRDPEKVRRAKVFPYQLLVASQSARSDVPYAIRSALEDALEVALENVPEIRGKVYVFLDISGSMHSPVTGYRRGSTTAVRCIDVASLLASALVKKNPQTEVIPFESRAYEFKLDVTERVLVNAQRLASLPCGGTNCSAPLALLNRRKDRGDLVIYVSDNESWIDSPYYGHFGGKATRTLQEWSLFKRRSPQAKMICIDIQPYANTQAKEREDIMNVGGFSDQVFNLIAEVASGNAAENFWVNLIDAQRI